MNPVGKSLFLIFVFVMTAAQVAAQEWRGLMPLRSTRADVVRLFGQCSDEKPWCEFTIENEEILIVFSKPGDCAVAQDTVLSIRRPREFVAVFQPHFQVITSVECPDTSVVAGEKVVITANYVRTGQRFLLTWHTTGGRILEGDNTRKILLDTTGVEEKAITVTVELNDSSQHTTTGSCTFKISRQIRS